MKILADRFVLSEAEPRKGGMAEVWQAVDPQDNLKPVAIKFMKGSRIHDDRILREAFSRELSALHALDHPNIVKIIDFDPRHDPPYMVLEWLHRDLDAYLETTVLHGWDDFYARIGGPVLDALSFAATKRLVHRDLKPGNILFDDYGTPKVADFGISGVDGYRFEPYRAYQSLNTLSDNGQFTPPRGATGALRCLCFARHASGWEGRLECAR